MAKIHGTYEYDDDLTPGKKKEGGLHQNLYDTDGKLRKSSRFMPYDEQPDEDYSPSYVDPYYAAQLAAEAEAEERRLERQRQEGLEIVLTLLTVGFMVAKPHADRLWQERLRPAIQAKREARALRKKKREERRASKKTKTASEAVVVEPEVAEGTVTEPTNDLVIAAQVYRRNMNSSEAQARYLMALAARAFSDEQLRLVAEANVVEDEQFGELERTLAELPPGQVANLIDQLELNPSVLMDDAFDLTRFLAEAALLLPVDERRDD